jgi:hypothetical protein
LLDFLEKKHLLDFFSKVQDMLKGRPLNTKNGMALGSKVLRIFEKFETSISNYNTFDFIDALFLLCI